MIRHVWEQEHDASSSESGGEVISNWLIVDLLFRAFRLLGNEYLPLYQADAIDSGKHIRFLSLKQDFCLYYCHGSRTETSWDSNT
jgi:hypothetical protein